jgi:pimeloyl-ACP methyl ester carboxylesterase
VATRSRPEHATGASPRLRCPLLVCACERDTVAPAGPTIRAAQRAPSAELIRYPFGHFDIYVDDGFERSSSDQLAFLGRLLDLS